jgi:hypothetical protein
MLLLSLKFIDDPSLSRCSEAGVLHETRYLVKTLCASCADSLGYTPVQQDTT